MFISSVVFRSTHGINSTLSGTTVFKNLLEKCILKRNSNFRVLKENSRFFCTSSPRLIKVTRFNKLADTLEQQFADTKAILNNVLIFKFERITAFRVVLVFSVVQLFGMFSMSMNLHKTFCSDLFESTRSWKQKFERNPFSITAIFCGCFFGPIIFLGIYFIACRTIRRIILHKGGEKVTFVTYNPIPNRRIFTESLENVSCSASRTNRSTLPLRVKGKKFYYYIDTDGEILNENLFDYTVGVKRDLD